MKKLLFQGDSITDCWRTSEAEVSLGRGYPKMIAQELARRGEEVQVINRGISGRSFHRSDQTLGPGLRSVRPGSCDNSDRDHDCWRKYDSGDETTTEEYESHYEFLIREIREKTQADLILMEPFVLPEPADRRTWRATLDPGNPCGA